MCVSVTDISITCTYFFIFLLNIYILDINECGSNPCVHGDCNDLVAGYTCTCDIGWEGTGCEIGKYKGMFSLFSVCMQRHNYVQISEQKNVHILHADRLSIHF